MDTATRTGRNLIEAALNRAIRTLKVDADIDPADREVHVDRDTVNVPGSPPLVETIFGKVDTATAFISDLTFVGVRADGERHMPNPNVLLEHGWALKSLTWRRVISVMNTAYGHPDKMALPFDLQHFRRPILYDCPEDANDEARAAAREGLARDLTVALKAILTDDAPLAGEPIGPHPHDVALLDRVRRQFPPRLRILLRRHNFGDRFPRRLLDPLEELREDWVGAEFEFVDPALQNAFAELRERIDGFSNPLNQHAFAIDNKLQQAWVRTDQDIAHGLQPGTLAAIETINLAATALAEALDTFERVGRDRVRVAPVEAEPEGPDPRAAAAMEVLSSLTNSRGRGDVPMLVGHPRVALQIVPFEAMDGRRLDPKAITALFPLFPPNPGDRVEEGGDADQWWVHAVPDRRGPARMETRWMTRLVRPGQVEYSATIGFREGDDAQIPIDGRMLEAQIVEGFERLGAILAGAGFSGPALIALALEGTEDVELTRARPGGRRIGRPFIGLPALEVEDFTAPVAPALHEAFDRIWQMSGWPDGSPSFAYGIWQPPAH
ncbi:hypothetical protein ACX40Y_04305 [Sphingomonas sp. RS6]